MKFPLFLALSFISTLAWGQTQGVSARATNGTLFRTGPARIGFSHTNGVIAGAFVPATGLTLSASDGGRIGGDISASVNSSISAQASSVQAALFDAQYVTVAGADGSMIGVRGISASNVSVSAINGSVISGKFDELLRGGSISATDGSFLGVDFNSGENLRVAADSSVVSLQAVGQDNVNISAVRSLLVGNPGSNFTNSFDSTVAVLGDNGSVTGFSTNGFFGNGSGMTNLNASELQSGTVPAARVVGAQDLSFSGTNISSGNGNLSLSAETGSDSVVIATGSLVGNGSGLTNLIPGSLPNPLITNTTATTWIWTNRTTGGTLMHVPGTGLVYSNGVTGGFSLLSGTNGGLNIGGISAAGPGNIIATNIVTALSHYSSNTIANNTAAYFSATTNANGNLLSLRYGSATDVFKVDSTGQLTLGNSVNGGGNGTFNGNVLSAASAIIGVGSPTYGGARAGLQSSTAGSLSLFTGISTTIPLTNLLFGTAASTNVQLKISTASTPSMSVVAGDGGVANAIIGGSVTATNGLSLPYTNAYISFVNVGASNAFTGSATIARIYATTNGAGANSAELVAVDGAGNHTLFSPHGQDGPASLYDATDEMPNVTREFNIYTGTARWINHSREARRVEQLLNCVQVLVGMVNTNGLTAQQLLRLNAIASLTAAQKDIISVNTNYIAPRSWTVTQNQIQAQYATGYTNALGAYTAAVEAGDTNAVAPVWNPPPVYPIPSQLQARGVQ